VRDIDLWIGGLFESLPNEDNTNRVNGGILGPTFACLLSKQFMDLKKGDRFFYENEPNQALNTLNTSFTMGNFLPSFYFCVY